uniref:GST C-terminal domain-containing protein n=1 Tax=Timema poppense TaxID=170557 RepID=A0A7R9DSK5_TIMPO|nr:unnamed protein product [Timema poppensis]
MEGVRATSDDKEGVRATSEDRKCMRATSDDKEGVRATSEDREGKTYLHSNSRAIMGYLVDQYGKSDSLYPKDPKKRALVDQRLYFDIGTIYQRYVDYLRPVLIFGEPEDAEKLKKIEEALAILEVFLEGKKWVAGDNITIADYTLAVSLSGIEETDIKLNNYPNVVKWFARAKTTIEGYEELNGAQAKIIGDMFRAKLK